MVLAQYEKMSRASASVSVSCDFRPTERFMQQPSIKVNNTSWQSVEWKPVLWQPEWFGGTSEAATSQPEESIKWSSSELK